jgi:hypothetical protein
MSAPCDKRVLDVVAEGEVWRSIEFLRSPALRALTKSAHLVLCVSRSSGPTVAITSSRGPPAVLS